MHVDLNESQQLDREIERSSAKKSDSKADSKLRISQETLYAIDKVVRRRVKEENFDVPDGSPSKLNESSQGTNTTLKRNMTFEEWFMRKEAER